MDDIEERLRSHAQAFDGLLSLIPAKFYYGDDTSDQWKRKKQTKEEARKAKRAKLDPDSAKTAKDVMDENARKRKRDEEPAGSESSGEEEELGSELPKEGLKRGDVKLKKQKPSEKSDDNPAKSEEAEVRKKLKEEKKAQKKANQKEKKQAKEASKKQNEEKEKKATSADAAQKSKSKPTTKTSEQEPPSKEDNSDNEADEEGEGVVAEELSFEFNPEQAESPSSAPSTPNSAEFEASGSSSISSIVPPTAPSDASKKSDSEPKPLKPTPEELKRRLQKRLDELRAARHADGLNGKPARNRQELIEARRQKAEQRKAHKKLLRQKAKEEEERLKDEAMVKRFSPGGSGSLLASPRSPVDSISSNTNFSFGRVVFADGQHADPTLTSVRDQPKHNGPKDPASALKAVEAKQARLASMDTEKRATIEEKDMWLNAKKRAHGERVRDDTSLLKKALKRKGTAKKRSEREWKERIETVAKGKEMRQQKREDNLRKRREEKGTKGGKKSAGGKKKARPGFEGSFKAKVGGKKK